MSLLPSRRPSSHQTLQPKISPRRFARLLRRTLNAKSCVLVRDYIVLVVGVDGLVLTRDGDFFGGQFDAGEVVEHVGVVGCVEVQMGEVGVAGLALLSGCVEDGTRGSYVPCLRQVDGYVVISAVFTSSGC